MTSFLNDRKSTVPPPHTPKDTENFLNSINPQNSAPPKTSKPFFVSSPNHALQDKGMMIYDWDLDHFSRQMLDDVSLDLAARFEDGLEKLSLEDIKNAILRIGDPVQDVSFTEENIGVKMSYAANRFSVPINKVREMAQQSLVHLSQ